MSEHMMRAFAGGLALASAMALGGCDRCSGVSPCTDAPHAGAQGRIVDNHTGRGVGGTRIDLVRVDVSARDSTSTSTDADGNFQLQLPGGGGTFDVVVSPKGLPSYRVKGLALRSSTTPGDANVLPPWVSTPTFGIAGELYYSSNTSVLVPEGVFYFQRTGGVQIAGPALVDGLYTAFISGGRVALLSGVNAAGLDDVVGDATIVLPDPFGATILHNFHITPSYLFRPRNVQRFGVGPQLGWIVHVYDRATVAPEPGTTVTFQRTGGIATQPESFTAVTNTSGDFYVPIVPLAKGTVIGDLSVQPPAPFNGYVLKNYHIPTYDGDGNPVFTSLGVGPHLPWLGTVTCNGRPLRGATVFVVRVGGIPAEPSQFYSTSDDNGNFALYTFKPKAYGDLIVDLEFTPPAGSGCIGLVHHNLVLPTFDIDTDARFISTWTLPRQ
jgi:hypothetical protein